MVDSRQRRRLARTLELMRVDELRPGLWRWTALHPDWPKEPDSGWDEEVSCLYYEAPDAVVLIDPLIPPEDRERFLAALDRDVERAAKPVAIELTIFWHERSSRELIDRYGASLWADERTLQRMDVAPTNAYRGGDRLPGGVVAYDAYGRWECLLWIEAPRALAVGDLIHGGGDGRLVLRDDWLLQDVTPGEVRARLSPLLELPVELVLPAHGQPVVENARAALEAVLEV